MLTAFRRFRDPSRVARMCFSVKPGDKVPISILTSEKDPVIKEDDEYPDWVHTLHLPQPTLTELERQYKSDPDSLSVKNLRRYYRLLNQKIIKDGNIKSGQGFR